MWTSEKRKLRIPQAAARVRRTERVRPRSATQRFDEQLASATVRRDELRVAIATAYPEYSRVGVEFAPRGGVTIDGKLGQTFGYSIRLHARGGGQPPIDVWVPVEATDHDITDELERALSLVGGGAP